MSTLISLSFHSSHDPNDYDSNQAIAGLMASYRSLPASIAKKHLKASMRRVLRGGVPILRRFTPPTNTRRGRRAKGEKAKSTGALRRSVTVRAGITGRNGEFDQFAWGCLGYRYGFESRKAIWLDQGTSGGVKQYRMIEKAMEQFGKPASKALADEMAKALEKAVKEAAKKKNPLMSRRGLAAGIRPRRR